MKCRVNGIADGQATVQEHTSACGKTRWSLAKGSGYEAGLEAAGLF